MSHQKIDMNRTVWVITGTVFILLSFLLLGAAIWEGVKGVKDNYFNISLPGFHELDLKSPGLYAGVYQQQGKAPLPFDVLTNLEIRIFEKGSYAEVPVNLNRVGQTFDRLGQAGMLVFNFIIQNPGQYTLSGFYLGDEDKEVQPIPIIIFAQAAQDIKQTLVVGIGFFILFLVMGIVMCVKGGKPKKNTSLTVSNRAIKAENQEKIVTSQPCLLSGRWKGIEGDSRASGG